MGILALQGGEDVNQRLTREPASTLDEQLNEDISQRMSRGDDFIEIGALYQYYENWSELGLDGVAIRFLTQSSFKHGGLGTFWLVNGNDEVQKETILETPNYLNRIEQAAKMLLIMGEESTLEKLLQQNQRSAKYGDLRRCKQMVGDDPHNRMNELLKENEHKIRHDGWSTDIQPTSMETSEIIDIIPEIAGKLQDLQERYENRHAGWSKRDPFQYALWDLEVVLGARLLV